MKPIVYILLFIASVVSAEAQVPKGLHLQPEKIRGGRFLKKNISFADYQTKKIRRTIGSYFATRPIIIENLVRVEGIPLFHKDKRRSKDYFHFNLYTDGKVAAYVDVQAVMLQNETFRLFGKQDSTFFGSANTDLLLSSIRLNADSSEDWELAAWNLNASKNEPQKGIIKKGDKEIRFEQSSMLLREPGDRNSIDTLFSTLYMVYRFSYNGETIGAVGYKENERICWIKESLDQNIKTVLAATISILRIRRDIYR